jgi:hypothetical protein
VQASLAMTPNSPPLITLRGEVELRQGEPWTALKSAIESAKLDPCNPRTHHLIASLDKISSHYAAARNEILTAHELDPQDPEIRTEWMMTLPLKQRMAEIETYLAAHRQDDEEGSKHLLEHLDHMKASAVEVQKPCHLVSPITAAEIPFASLMADATHVAAFGLEVKLNNRTARLQIDTGAGGLLVSRSVAKHARLEPFAQTEMEGIGDEGSRGGYTAYADSIRIGGLEFQNCAVRVLDDRSFVGVDGLIGMDVFSKFLVTLDYPMRKLMLDPLPPRPGALPATALELNTSDVDVEDSQASDDSRSGTLTPVSMATVTGEPATASKTPQPVPVPAISGEYNRYIAPEMKDYTPVYRVGHDLILPAVFNDQKLKLMIMDTGSWATTISPKAAREVTKIHRDRSLNVEGISGRVDKVYYANEVTFRLSAVSQQVHDVVAFDTSRVSNIVGMEISGFLGANTLEQMTIHIDYRDGLVKFDYDPKRGFRK